MGPARWARHLKGVTRVPVVNPSQEEHAFHWTALDNHFPWSCGPTRGCLAESPRLQVGVVDPAHRECRGSMGSSPAVTSWSADPQTHT